MGWANGMKTSLKPRTMKSGIFSTARLRNTNDIGHSSALPSDLITGEIAAGVLMSIRMNFGIFTVMLSWDFSSSLLLSLWA